MKTFFFVLGHLVLLALFLALANPFAVFFLSLYLGLHAHWFVTSPAPGVTHYFVPAGLIVITVIYAVIVLLEALMRRRRAVLWTSIVWVLGAAAALTFGWVTHGPS